MVMGEGCVDGGGVSGDGWRVQWMVMVEVQYVMVGGGCSGWVRYQW